MHDCSVVGVTAEKAHASLMCDFIGRGKQCQLERGRNVYGGRHGARFFINTLALLSPPNSERVEGIDVLVHAVGAIGTINRFGHRVLKSFVVILSAEQTSANKRIFSILLPKARSEISANAPSTLEIQSRYPQKLHSKL